MKNISFALTKEQILNRTKTVTRRLDWGELKPGDRLQAVEKGMGLKKGEKVNKLAVIEVVRVTREPLLSMNDTEYGCIETELEGFPEMGGDQFVQMFCKHMHCKPETMITRVEFRYVEP